MKRSLDDLSRAAGLGYRQEIAPQLHAHTEQIGFLEVVAESCYGSRSTLREIIALAEIWPVVPHGVKLSLGSAEGIDATRAEKLGELVRQTGAPASSEHVAITAAGGRKIGHLTPIPRSLEAVAVVARNVDRARRFLDVPLLLENIATSFPLPGDVLSEAAFYQEIVEQTGCPLLFDVANLYANAINAGVDPLQALREFPVESAAMVHVAGGVLEHGFYFDTHAHPVPDAVFDLLAQVFARAPDVPVLLERDANLETGIAPLIAELGRVVRSPRGAPSSAQRIPPKKTAPPMPSFNDAALIAQQASLARLLTDGETTADRALAEEIGADGLRRARSVLQRKRVEEALALLPRLRKGASDVHGLARALGESIIRAAPRTGRMQAVSDALAISSSASLSVAEKDAALRDAVVLRARFSIDASGAKARAMPFVARAVLSDGHPIWAMKGVGVDARVHVRERRRA